MNISFLLIQAQPSGHLVFYSIIFSVLFSIALFVKGMMSTSDTSDDVVKYCSNCAEGLKSSENFCSACGHPTDSAPDDHIMCVDCGSINSRDDDFCTNCGSPSNG